MPTPSSPSSSVDRFARFCERLAGLELEPFQRLIVETHWRYRETLCLIARGNGKSQLAAALAVYHLLTTRQPAVYVGAASRDQARILFESARDIVTANRTLERHAGRRRSRSRSGHTASRTTSTSSTSS